MIVRRFRLPKRIILLSLIFATAVLVIIWTSKLTWKHKYWNITVVDHSLNVRKLSLFAVHELNQIVSSSEQNLCSNRNSKSNICPKWWTNPLDTVHLRTTKFDNYSEHYLSFIGNPGRLAFLATILQYPFPTNWMDLETFQELKINSDFRRLEVNMVPKRFDLPPEPEGAGEELERIKNSNGEPELYSWRRTQSFMVRDYADYNDNSGTLYPISPKNSRDTYCGSTLKMLVMIGSAPSHFENRKVIRETFGSNFNLDGKRVRLVFRFGRVSNQPLQNLLEAEAAGHNDMIQGDFMDSYHNLTLSHLLMLNWLQKTCAPWGLPRYILKADDDIFLNVELALRVVYENPQYELIGQQLCGTEVYRDQNPFGVIDMWYQPKYIYAPDLYVGYLSGATYVLRTDLIPFLLKASLTTPMNHIDDVYVTGLLSRQLNVWPVNSALFDVFETFQTDPCIMRKIVNARVDLVDDFRQYWAALINSRSSHCLLDDLNDTIHIPPLTQQQRKDCLYSVN